MILRYTASAHHTHTHSLSQALQAKVHTGLQGFTFSSGKLYNQPWYWVVIGEEMSRQNVLMTGINAGVISLIELLWKK